MEDPDKLETQYKIGQTINEMDDELNLMGFTSATREKRKAEGHAFEKMALARLQKMNRAVPGELGHLKLDEDHSNLDACPVIFKIDIASDIYHFDMNHENFSAFHETEKEVLLQDGLCLRVLLIESERYEAEYINQLPHIQRLGVTFQDKVFAKIIHLEDS